MTDQPHTGPTGADPQQMRDQATALHDAAAKLEAAADALECSTPEGATVLGGRCLQDALLEATEPGEVFHYRDAFHRLRAAGISPTGRDPMNTLLAVMTRSPYFSTARPRTGEWRQHAPEEIP